MATQRPKACIDRVVSNKQLRFIPGSYLRGNIYVVTSDDEQPESTFILSSGRAGGPRKRLPLSEPQA